MSKMEQTTFEDDSTIHFGGDGEARFDLFAGFDSDSDGDAADTTLPGGAEAAADAGTGAETAPDHTEPEAPTTEPEEPDTASKLTFKAKIDHQERDVTIQPEELPELYQKASNMERAVQRADAARQDADRYRTYIQQTADLARSLGFSGDTPEEAVNALMNGVAESTRSSRVEALVQAGTAQEVAEFVVSQQLGLAKGTASAEPAGDSADTAEQEPQEADAPSSEQFARDLQSLMEKRPDLGASGHPFPEEVLAAYMRGENLTVAYLDYEAKQTAAEKQALEKQNRIFRQNQESAARGPVKGISGSGDPGGKEDPWTAGFDERYW